MTQPKKQFTPQQIASMGIVELETERAFGNITTPQALSVVQGRIDKRIAEKRPLVVRVVEYRNKLAALEGVPAMPVPSYIVKTTTPTSSAVAIDTSDISALADKIIGSGVDLPLLMGALASRMNQPAAA